MERKIINDLHSWKLDPIKKPLLLYGVSGSGKTYTALEFGKKEYKNVIYFDCLDNLELSYVFDKNNTLEKLLRGLAAISLETVFKGETLLIFDRVTEKIIKVIDTLFKGVSDYSIMMLTNSLTILNIAKTKKYDFLLKQLSLVTFPEYLKYVGKEQLVEFIYDSFHNGTTMPFHGIAEEAYRDYVLTGGYPEAIVTFQQTGDYSFLSIVHSRLLELLMTKFFEVENPIDVKRGMELYNQIPIQLLKDNKKFLYGMIRRGARSKDYERILKFMEENNFLIKCRKTSELVYPLSKNKDDESFKLYMNDSGLLFKKMNISVNRLVTNDKLMAVLYENSVINTLCDGGYIPYYYQSVGKALVDLVIQTRNGKIIPIEFVVGEYNTKSKSLGLSMNKYNLDYAVRFGNFNFRKRNGIQFLPYYAAFCLLELL